MLAIVITHKRMLGINKPIPAPANNAKNMVIINVLEMDNPKNPIAKSVKALPPKDEK
jgi:hypothetical protein